MENNEIITDSDADNANNAIEDTEIQNNKYPGLRSIAGILKFMAYAVLVVLAITIYKFSDNDNGAVIIGGAVLSGGI